MVRRLADFATHSAYADLSERTRLQLRIRILDALGCALGARGSDTVERVRDHVMASGADGSCTFIGGGRGAPDRAALLNGALVRYLDFDDSYLAPRETCHPSDNLAAVLAAAELAQADGRTLLTALAVAYQVQCRLSDVAPVRDRGFDHVTHLAYSAAAGAARAIGLDAVQAANAIGIAGTALNALRVTRTGALSHWKGLAAPFGAANALEATLLAARGITGPAEVFEGNKGFMQTIAGPFDIAWEAERLDRVEQTILKRFNAEVHSQSAIQAVLDLRRSGRVEPSDVERVDVRIFDVAHRIIGGGEEGDKHSVATKEDADHSLPYLLAVTLLDGQVMPAQYEPERIRRADVQQLLQRITVQPDPEMSHRFPAEMPVRITVELSDGRVLTRDRSDYPGFTTLAMSWDDAVAKFHALSTSRTEPAVIDEIVHIVRELDTIPVTALTQLLARAGSSKGRASREPA